MMRSRQQIVQIIPKPTLQTSSILREANHEGQFIQINRYETEQNAIYINYENTQLINKLNSYASMNFYYRMCYTKHISSIREYLLNQYTENYKQFLLAVTRDPSQEIRKTCLEEFKSVILVLQKNISDQTIYNQLKDCILGCLLIFITYNNLDIKEEAAKLITQIIPLLKKQDSNQLIQKLAISLAHSDTQQNKFVSIFILIGLAKSSERKQSEELIQKQILKLGTCQYSKIRKQVILQLPMIFKYVSQKFLETTLVEYYLKKCQENVWSVRKACVNIIYELYQAIKQSSLKSSLQNCILSFLKDGNKIVRIDAHKRLPYFICQIQKNQLNSISTTKLLDQYLKLVDSQVNHQVTANQIIQNVAYTFPAVLLAIGSEKWKQLIAIYQKLFKINDKNIKLPLGCSLHQVAKILGPQTSKKYLFNCLDSILKDNSQELKMGTIQHLSQFVQIFNHQTKQNLIDVFLVLQKDPRKWRIRYSIAHQISKLAQIYDSQTVFKYILPISFKLCTDPVSDVRKAASQNIWIFVQIFKDNEAFLYVALESIKGFACSTKFNQRQSFLIMCKNLLKYEQFFEKQIVPLLFPLLQDHIVVKILLSQLLSNISSSNLKSNERIQQIYEKLTKDEDEDVRESLIGK